MSAAFTVDPQRIFHISPPETTNTSELMDLARFANALASAIEEDGWENVPPELQDVLTKYAYRETERSQPLLRRWRARLRYTVLVLRGEEEALFKQWNASNRLRAVVLDAIECNNPEYRKDLSEAIKGALSDTDGRTMNAEQARERNRQIFDQVFE